MNTLHFRRFRNIGWSINALFMAIVYLDCSNGFFGGMSCDMFGEISTVIIGLLNLPVSFVMNAILSDYWYKLISSAILGPIINAMILASITGAIFSGKHERDDQ